MKRVVWTWCWSISYYFSDFYVLVFDELSHVAVVAAPPPLEPLAVPSNIRLFPDLIPIIPEISILLLAVWFI